MSKVTTGIPIPQQSYAPQPPPQYGQHQRTSGSFSTGLCDCCSDMSSCCLTCWCPCITFGRIAEIVDRGSTSCCTSGTLYTLLLCLTGCQSIYSCTYRSKLKAQLGMPDNCCADLCSHCCCEYCALCQEYRELQHRGYNLALGWQGNMERQNPGIAMPPQVPSGMARY
ncbi:protein PLANT CADMIUM RESISTANCE 2-like [Chenopodium quinoa]|uniref:protein PLANT CADMIUM RESISTANCE 2-like n=1 Tax=Chenopodium quinoa TaxID=63459 RepID=UPI000B79692B|nr:protein PLANT CADMIUM RESISTANCE 2-like [Chenopodium quinoa]